MKVLFLMVSVNLVFGFTSKQKSLEISSNRIIIESKVSASYKDKFIDISFVYPQTDKPGYYEKVKKKIEIREGFAKCELVTEGSIVAWGPLLYAGRIPKINSFISIILEPGDHIIVRNEKDRLVYSGKGALKLELAERLSVINDSLNRLPICETCILDENLTRSIEDYLYWNQLLNSKMQLMLRIIESYRSRLSSYAYNFIKDRVISEIEESRMEKFIPLMVKVDPSKINAEGEPVNELGLSNNDLAIIYDSTMNGPGARWVQFDRPFVTSHDYLYTRLFLDIRREKGRYFKISDKDMPILDADRFTQAYSLAKIKYKGIIREAALSFMFWYVRGAIYQFGFTPEIEALLNDYYTQSKYPKYREYTKKDELERRKRYNRVFAADFSLMDIRGNSFSKEKLKGKIAILDFWFTGCIGCVQMAPALRNVEEHFKNDTNVIFLSISIDKSKEQWIKSIGTKKYTSGTGVQLYTGGRGKDHDMITKYGVTGYPTLYMIDPYDRVLWNNKVPDPRSSKGSRELIALIEKLLSYLKDGPYVFYEINDKSVFSITNRVVNKRSYNNGIEDKMFVSTDMNTNFSVNLQKELKIQSSEFARPEKLLVLSDIEGNFDAFRMLLQKNKVIDENYNWVYGDGHLVFAGDMFDRGMQVTECLWLIYSLEEKAKAAGGYVHFILGNHEIMNLQGDDDYVQKKYKDNAVLMGKTYKQLYNEDSELGRWLRTKNIVEKIGDMLFAHGGISRALNLDSVTLKEVNQLARPQYSVRKANYSDSRLNTIMSSSAGPFWYRGYYADGAQAPMSVIDSTLQKFNVSRIITGHTIVADTISVHYGGKVINTDTKHAEGKSEALLIEGDHYYRVNQEGKRVLLFVDDKKKTSPSPQ